jgi:hypothetical protein
MVEFGGSLNTPILITLDIVESMAEHLLRMCNSMCGNEHYAFRVGVFRLTTIGTLRAARMYFDEHYLHFKLAELQYLERIFHIVNNQLKAYAIAKPDVKTYVISALGITTYLNPAPNANNSFLYFQLYEEIKEPLI